MKRLLTFIFLIIPITFFSQTQIGEDIDGEATDDRSGWSVSLSNDGSIVAIGAYLNDGVNGVDSGHVRVYENINNVWTQIGQDIDGEASDPGPNPGDNSGYYVSLSSDGSVVAIGARRNGSGTWSGHVRVYENINDVWTQIGQDIDGEGSSDESGRTLSLSNNGNIVAIGAFLNDGVNGEDSGHVRIYQNITGVWTQIGNDIDGEAAGDYSGYGVSLSGDGGIVAIGAYRNDGVNGENSGHVRIYQNISNVWTQVGNDIDGESDNDLSGITVKISSDGSIVAIGALSNDGVNGDRSGNVRVYKNISDVWIQIGNDIDGEAAGDESGYGLSLSSDGSIIAIGARSNSGNGNSSGHVRVYKNIGGIWTIIGDDIDGETEGDRSGNASLSLSDDGSVVAIGASWNDGVNGENSGHVRVYNLSTVLSSETFVQKNISIYPNPAKSTVTISLENILQLNKVTIYNQLGQFVKEETDSTIDVSKLSKGLYLLEIETTKGKATKKIVIE